MRPLKRYQRGFWNFVLPAVATLGASLIGRKGQAEANTANANLNAENMAFNAGQAQIARGFSLEEMRLNQQYNSAEAAANRDFQSSMLQKQMDYNTEMANSSYQRAVGDLSKAGLNPMLAYSQGGASTPNAGLPSGSQASSGRGGTPQASYSNYGRQESTALAALNSAMGAMQVSNMGKQGANIDADTALKQAQAAREEASAGNLKAGTELIITGSIPKVRKEIIEIENNIINKDAQKGLIEAQTLLTKTEQMVKTGEISRVEADTALKKVDTILKELRIPEEKAYAEKFSGDYGKNITPYVREILQILWFLTRRGQ